MRSFALSLAVTLAFAGTAFAQTSHTASTAASAAKSSSAQKSVQAAPLQKASVARSAPRPAKPTQKAVQAARYGGFSMGPPPPPPTLDLTSPRSLSLVNVNTGEALSVTYWADGSYRRDALNKLNHFLRDSHENAETEMDPLLFDVLWHTSSIVGFSGTIEVFSAYRSPSTNAWLASTQRGVASDSQHINGNAMDIRLPGVPVLRIREAARSLNMGGVGFYPRSGFVHLDTGPVRYW